MHGRFVRTVLGLNALAVLVCMVVAAWMQPLAGDLTRVGGYAERAFGWNGEQAIFDPPLATRGDPARHADIVVIGNSFSSRTTPDRQTPEGGFWTDFLAAETGLAVAVFDLNTMSVDRLLADPGYRAAPPRLLILEIVERGLRDRLGAPPARCSTAPTRPMPTLAFAPAPRPAGAMRRDITWHTPLAPLDQGAATLRRALPRWIAGLDMTKSLRLPLSRPDLFSSGQPQTLAIAADQAKRRWSDADWVGFGCRLRNLQNRVEADGRTGFLLVLAPDKTSAYAAYLPPLDWPTDGAARLAAAPGLHMPRLDVALRAAIAAGARDVYLPRTPHWGSAGSRLVARVVADAVRRTVMAESGSGR